MRKKRSRFHSAAGAGIGGIYPVRRTKNKPTVEIGDLVIVDSGRLGVDIEDREGRRLCWFNAAGAKALRKWLADRKQNDACVVDEVSA